MEDEINGMSDYQFKKYEQAIRMQVEYAYNCLKENEIEKAKQRLQELLELLD